MGLRLKSLEKLKLEFRDIYLESPKNITEPNLKKPATGECVPTMSEKCAKTQISAVDDPRNGQKSLFKPK